MAIADAGASSISVTGRGALNQGLRKLTAISSCSTFHNSRSRAIVGRLAPNPQQYTDDTEPNAMMAHCSLVMAPLLVFQHQSLGKREFDL
jgi:hypothetical protein